MSTSPIIAAPAPASYTPLGSADHGGSADSADFHKTLQEVSSSDSRSDNSSPAAPVSSPDSPEAIKPDNDEAAALRRCSATDGGISKETGKADSASTEHCAKQEKYPGGKTLSRSKTRKEVDSSTANKEDLTMSGTPNFHILERLPLFEIPATELCADSTAPAPTDADAVAMGATEFSASSFPAALPNATGSDSSITKTESIMPDRPLTDASSTPAAEDAGDPSSFTLRHLAANTTLASASQSRMAMSSIATKSKARPQATTFPERKGGIAEDTQSIDAGNAAPTNPRFLTHDHRVSDSVSAVIRATPVPDSSRATASRSGHSHSQTAAQGDNIFGGQEKTDSTIAGGSHNSGTGFPSDLITRVALDQSAAAQPATTSSAHGATADATQSLATVLAPHAQNSAPVVAHPQPKIESYPIPNPPRLVNSGQLRVSTNSSELKISVQLPELGKVDVRAVTSHDVTIAHLSTSHHDALQVLVADRSGLEQALRSRDVILGSLSSGVPDSHAQDSHGQSAGQQQQQHYSAQSLSGTSSVTTATTTSIKEEGGTLGLLPEYTRISVRA